VCSRLAGQSLLHRRRVGGAGFKCENLSFAELVTGGELLFAARRTRHRRNIRHTDRLIVGWDDK